MASFQPSFCSLSKPFYRPKVHKFPQVRSQSFHDQGNSANIVDANLRVLRERIEELRRKERLDTHCILESNGWNYKSGYENKHNRQVMLSETIEIIVSVSSSLGLVFLIGSLCIFFVSFVILLFT